jgi:hypothetical protein
VIKALMMLIMQSKISTTAPNIIAKIIAYAV